MAIFHAAETLKYRLKMEAGLSVQDLAAEIGIHPSAVSMVINGHRKSQPVFEAIAKHLNEEASYVAAFISGKSSEEFSS